MAEGWREELWVPPGKILDYLLSETNPAGRSKAEFFVNMGFSRQTPDELAEMLLRHGRKGGLAAQVRNQHGLLHVVEGPAEMLRGRVVLLRSVWIRLDDGGPTRLVTAYPIGGSQ